MKTKKEVSKAKYNYEGNTNNRKRNHLMQANIKLASKFFSSNHRGCEPGLSVGGAMGNLPSGRANSARRLQTKPTLGRQQTDKRRSTKFLHGRTRARRSGDPNDPDPVEVFGEAEYQLMSAMFLDLSMRSPDSTMDKDTFLKFFNAPGLLGERLFRVFDRDGNGVIDENEFMTGLAVYLKGTTEEKIRLLFRMYDLRGDQAVNKDELRTMLLTLVTPATSYLSSTSSAHLMELIQNQNNGGVSATGGGSPKKKGDTNSPDVQPLGMPGLFQQLSRAKEISPQEELEMVDKIVEDAFSKCDTSKDGRLQFEEFSAFIEQQPEILNNLERIFMDQCWSDPRVMAAAASPAGLLPGKNSATSRIDVDTLLQGKEQAQILKCVTCPWICKFCPVCGGKLTMMAASKKRFLSPLNAPHNGQDGPVPFGSLKKEKKEEKDQPEKGSPISQAQVLKCLACKKFSTEQSFSFCMMCGSGTELATLQNNSADLLNESHLKHASKRNVAFEGCVFSRHSNSLGTRPGKHWKERFLVVRSSFLYYYGAKDQKRPKEVLFLLGCFIDPLPSDEYSKEGYFGFELSTPSERTMVFYCRNTQQRRTWIKVLREAAKAHPIQDFYKIGKEIGKGKFATVYQATHKVSNTTWAVKAISKAKLGTDRVEKEQCRAEIAIMRLIRHPAIVRLEEIYESKDTLFIVMPLITSGDLFARIVEKGRYPEQTAKLAMWRLLDALGYLHDRGIVHRDLKPENILCANEQDDSQIVLADFGLSSFFMTPEEMLEDAVGTLNYVAPEVLQFQGYTKAVDVWSAGIIMYVLLSGELPFGGKTQEQIVERTKKSAVKFSNKWDTVSQEARTLVLKMLQKSPQDRITLQAAIQDVWFRDVKKNYDGYPTVSRDSRPFASPAKESKSGPVELSVDVSGAGQRVEDTEKLKQSSLYVETSPEVSGDFSRASAANSTAGSPSVASEPSSPGKLLTPQSPNPAVNLSVTGPTNEASLAEASPASSSVPGAVNIFEKPVVPTMSQMVPTISQAGATDRGTQVLHQDSAKVHPAPRANTTQTEQGNKQDTLAVPESTEEQKIKRKQAKRKKRRSKSSLIPGK
eukprot:g12520.t1